MSFVNNIAILVPSCDLYSDLWAPFFKCFFKYWPDCPYPVYLGSNTLVHPDPKIQPITIGDDVDYSSNLLKMLDGVPQEWVILWVEDRVLSNSVDTKRVEEFVSYSIRNNAGYTKMIASHPFSLSREEGPGVGKIPKGARYRFGITVGLWRKNLLKELLTAGESAWELEHHGSRRSDAMNDAFYALHYKKRLAPPLQDTHLVMKGAIVRNAVPFLKHEGCDGFLSRRPVQSIGSFLYMRAYLSALDIMSWIRWRWAYDR